MMDENLQPIPPDPKENLAEAGIQGDTNIYVTPANAAPRPPLPEFRPTLGAYPPPSPAPVSGETQAPVEQGQSPTQSGSTEASQQSAQTSSSEVSRMGEQTLTTTTSETKEHKKINWGGVLKGVALVTAVAVAGVVGFYALSSLATMALHVPAIGSIAATVQTATAPVVTAVSGGLHWLAGFAPALIHAPAAFFSHLAMQLGIGGATAGTVATLAPAAAHSVTTALGTLGAGAGIALAVHPAANAIQNLNLVDHTHSTTLTSADHASTSTMPENAHEGSFLSNLFASKNATTMASHSLTEGSHIPGYEAHGNEAFEVSHTGHSAHEQHHGGNDTDASNTPDLPDEDHGRPKRAWASRAQTGNAYRKTLMESGSHSAAVTARAAQAPDGGEITPRSAAFADAVSDNRKLQGMLQTGV